MAGRRERAAQLLDHCAMVRPLARLRGLVQRDLPILAYHRVLELGDETCFPFDPELVSASPADFRRQMEYIARHFTPVNFAHLCGAMMGERPLPSDSIAVTFDDGYFDNYTEAFPILQDLAIPATIFLSTGYIGGREPYWYDRVAYALYHHPGDTLQLPGTEWRFRIDTDAARRRAGSKAVERLKRLPDAKRRSLLRAMAAQIDLEIDPGDVLQGRPMAWDHVKEMHAAGVEFGSHTVTHPVLTQLDDDALAFELRESRRHLETVLGGPVRALSYPFGGPADYDARVIGAARAAGYRLGASYIGGRNDHRLVAEFDLRRLHVERYTSMPMFTSMLAVPQLFGQA